MTSLTQMEMKNIIEGKGSASRIPMAFHEWIDPNSFGADTDKCQELLTKYPSDIQKISINMPHMFDAPADAPSYCWMDTPPHADYGKGKALDSLIAITDWRQLDGILANFPKADYPGLTKFNLPNDGRYRVGHWWFWLFERLWSFRGMENAMMDFYEESEQVHRLFRALTDFYKGVLTHCKKVMNLDAIWTSDDIGTQNGPFFSPDIFKTFFKPYYKELIVHAHSLDMHFWLHSCGNIAPFIPEFIEIGLDVLHPIQKYTMDEKSIARDFGDKICIWAGFDVQQVIPYGTEEDVRQEVRFMIDTYYRPDGRFVLGAGNGITSDTKIECLEALLEETYNYSTLKMR